MGLRIYSALCSVLSAASVANLLPLELEASAGRGKLRFAEFPDGSFAAGFVGIEPNIVHGRFDDQLSTVGWMYLDLATNASYTNIQQAYAAGYAESAATVPRTWQSFLNNGVVNSTLPGPVMAWITNNSAFMHEQVWSTTVDM